MNDIFNDNVSLKTETSANAKLVLGAVPFVNEVACVAWEDAIKQVFTNSIDLVLTDPPYGIAYRSNSRKKNIKASKTILI